MEQTMSLIKRILSYVFDEQRIVISGATGTGAVVLNQQPIAITPAEPERVVDMEYILREITPFPHLIGGHHNVQKILKPGHCPWYKMKRTGWLYCESDDDMDFCEYTFAKHGEESFALKWKHGHCWLSHSGTAARRPTPKPDKEQSYTFGVMGMCPIETAGDLRNLSFEQLQVLEEFAEVMEATRAWMRKPRHERITPP